MVLYSSLRTYCVLQHISYLFSARDEHGRKQDKRLWRVHGMIYWEITLRDHLLLPITPDSSGDTTYVYEKRRNMPNLYGTSLGKQRCTTVKYCMRY